MPSTATGLADAVGELAMSLRTLGLTSEGGLVTITLDRPEVANAIDLPMARELAAVTQLLTTTTGPRAVLLGASGPNFCGGGDLASFLASDDVAAYVGEAATVFHVAVAQLAALDAPVVAAVQGSAFGGGLALACGCDLVVAAVSARFCVAYPGVGLSPDGGSSYSLPKMLGLRRALDLCLTGQVVGAEQALELGLVSRVVPDDELAERSRQLAADLAAGPTRALGATKRLLRQGVDDPLEVCLARETEVITAFARTPDAAKGLRAFAEGVRPRFEGLDGPR